MTLTYKLEQIYGSKSVLFENITEFKFLKVNRRRAKMWRYILCLVFATFAQVCIMFLEFFNYKSIIFRKK